MLCPPNIHPSIIVIHCALLRKTSPRMCILFVSQVVHSCTCICIYTAVIKFVVHTQLYLYLYVHSCFCICCTQMYLYSFIIVFYNIIYNYICICMYTVSSMQSIAQKGIAQNLHLFVSKVVSVIVVHSCICICCTYTVVFVFVCTLLARCRALLRKA